LIKISLSALVDGGKRRGQRYHVMVANPKVPNVKVPNIKVPTQTLNCRPFKLSNCQIVHVIKCRTYLACSLTPPNWAALF
jgi:hypothetical protein